MGFFDMINTGLKKVNEGTDEHYQEAMRSRPIDICRTLAQNNPVSSPLLYSGYTRALRDQLYGYGDLNYFYEEAKSAVRGYKYERQAMMQIEKVLSRM